MMSTIDKPNKAVENRRKDGTFGPNNNANPKGRPKGKTLKEYQAEKFREMTDEERDEFLKEITKDIRWRMAEGNPATNTDITTGGEKIVFMPPEIIEKYKLDETPSSPEQNSQ